MRVMVVIQGFSDNRPNVTVERAMQDPRFPTEVTIRVSGSNSVSLHFSEEGVNPDKALRLMTQAAFVVADAERDLDRIAVDLTARLRERLDAIFANE